MNIFISNLGCHVDGADLYHFFAPFGHVASATVVTDKDTGKSLRYGFVDMPDDACIQQAIQKLNGKVVEGRSMSVSLSKGKAANSKVLSINKNRTGIQR